MPTYLPSQSDPISVSLEVQVISTKITLVGSGIPKEETDETYSGRLTDLNDNPIANMPIVFTIQYPGGNIENRPLMTNAMGYWGTIVRFPDPGTAYLTVRFDGTAQYAPCSKQITVSVGALEVTTVTTLTGPTTAYVDTPVSFTAELKTSAGVALVGMPMELWINEVLHSQSSTDTSGRCVFTVVFTAPGTYTLVAKFPGVAT